MALLWFVAQYPARPEWENPVDEQVGNYGSYIHANSPRHARLLARRRNIGEKVISSGSRRRKRPYPLASEILSKRALSKSDVLDAVHSACFLGYLLMQSRGAPPCDVLGDQGLVHQVIHTLSLGSPRRKDMVGTLRYFEGLVPGYL